MSNLKVKGEQQIPHRTEVLFGSGLKSLVFSVVPPGLGLVL
jgi:hypothetical protein